MVAFGLLFFGLLIFIKDLLPTRRSTRGGSSSTATGRTRLTASMRKWSMSSCIGGLIGGIPLHKRVIKLW